MEHPGVWITYVETFLFPKMMSSSSNTTVASKRNCLFNMIGCNSSKILFVCLFGGRDFCFEKLVVMFGEAVTKKNLSNLK